MTAAEWISEPPNPSASLLRVELVNNRLWSVGEGKEKMGDTETNKLTSTKYVNLQAFFFFFARAPSFVCRWRFQGVPFLQHQPSYSNAAHLTGEDNIKKGISRNGSRQ